MTETMDPKNLRGFRRLAGDVLVQAIEDLNRGCGRTREDAIQWIADAREDHFSFVYCCRMLSRSPDQMRRVLLRRILPHLVSAPDEWIKVQ